MDALNKNLHLVRIPNNGDRVYKDECVYCFDTPECETGLYVCLNTFLGVGRDFVDLHYRKSGNGVFLHILRTKREKANVDCGDGESQPKKLTKLGIGIEGGLMPDSSKYDYDETCSIVIYPGFLTISLPNPKIPDIVLNSIAAIQAADSAARLEELQAAAGTWDGEKRQVSRYAENLVQLDNGVKVPPRNWKCSKCDLRENLWMNLTDGTICCGRRFFDGSGGNNHALEHYEQTKYPLAVKLGTITPKGADVYSYAEDDMVEDPYLAKHLAHFGICITQMEKSDKSMIELELDYNQRIGEWAIIQESDSVLTPLCGPGYTGLVNLGNSCYLNSVLQVLFSMEEFQNRYYPPNSIFENSAIDPTNDFNAQMAKIAYGLFSGKYSIECKRDDGLPSVDQKGIKLNMFKTLVGKGHPEFSSKRQQDAQEFFLHLINLIERNKHLTNGTNPANCLKFQFEERVECMQSHKVSYMTRTEYLIPLPIPLEKATNLKEVAEFEELKKKMEENKETVKDIVRPKIPLDACFDAFIQPEIVDDFYSTAINGKTKAMKSTKLKSFPDYLMIQLKKFTFDDNWVPKKLDVSIEVPDVIDLIRLRGTGLQPGEEKLPDFKTHHSSEENSGGNSSSSSVSFDATVLTQLCEMGFSVDACKRAMFNTQNAGVETALNWLFEHQNDSDFNSPFTQDQPAAEGTTFFPDPIALETLKSMGLPEDQAKRGLRETNNNVERAIDWIFSHQEEFASPMEVDSGMECLAAAAAVPEFNDGSEKYRLMAFISHMGSSTMCGHYVCHIFKDGKWVIFNDNKVALSEHPPKDLAYLYLYKRI
ncbi:ubiquitin carboxyl-terminal hydrolase 5-like protein [Dinothrombium tinctorium]|uniref:Ubiquitin carboxyl-terminal hydrolase n=1 Tax=Dinothrombium tinctorium TaxID=1965070 RepID=A0A3S3P5B8_9ACAR|nr:ubiquitin carboxyl-terminal hydrolase 5-like protein [Dinothrombium tinctorium]